MHKEVIRTHVESIREIAMQFATDGSSSGMGEVAMLLRRAADKAEAIAKGAVVVADPREGILEQGDLRPEGTEGDA